MVRAAVRGEAPDVTPPAYGDDGSARGIALLQLADSLNHRI
jgi:hypothetical protein